MVPVPWCSLMNALHAARQLVTSAASSSPSCTWLRMIDALVVGLSWSCGLRPSAWFFDEVLRLLRACRCRDTARQRAPAAHSRRSRGMPLSARFAIAIVCAYVPGASRLSRCSSGRFRSDHSSSVRSVSTPANCFAPGSNNIAMRNADHGVEHPQPRLLRDVEQLEGRASGQWPTPSIEVRAGDGEHPKIRLVAMANVRGR